jgi:anti-sigma factor RsiW
MTTAHNAISDEELHAFVDGELDPKRAAQIEALLADEAVVAEAVQGIRTQNARLHLAFDGVLDEPVPNRLIAAKPRQPHIWRAAAALAWLAVGAAIGWGVRDARVEPQHIVLPRQAAIAHAAFTPEVRHPVEVSAAEEAHLVAWLSKRLGARVRAPKLGDLGYELLGGRLLPEAGRPGAQFMYQDATGKRLTLYVSTDVDNRDTAFRYATEGRVHVFYWIDQHLGYALSGEIEKTEMLRIARRVYEQLNP